MTTYYVHAHVEEHTEKQALSLLAMPKGKFLGESVYLNDATGLYRWIKEYLPGATRSHLLELMMRDRE